jgi:hypothetical protein
MFQVGATEKEEEEEEEEEYSLGDVCDLRSSRGDLRYSRL